MILGILKLILVFINILGDGKYAFSWFGNRLLDQETTDRVWFASARCSFDRIFARCAHSWLCGRKDNGHRTNHWPRSSRTVLQRDGISRSPWSIRCNVRWCHSHGHTKSLFDGNTWLWNVADVRPHRFLSQQWWVSLENHLSVLLMVCFQRYSWTGKEQPGCAMTQGRTSSISRTLIEDGIREASRVLVACDHIRAIKLFTDSINSKCPYVGWYQWLRSNFVLFKREI